MNRDRDVIREPTDEDYKWATQDMNKDRCRQGAVVKGDGKKRRLVGVSTFNS